MARHRQGHYYPGKEEKHRGKTTQQSGGTAEEKVAFEVICLADAVKRSNGKFAKAIVVLGGNGWTLRDWYVDGGLKSHIVDHGLVEILTLEEFVARANKGKL